MLCNMGTTDNPFSESEYSTRGGISSNDFLIIISLEISSFSEAARTASVIFPISFLSSL